MKKAIKTLAAIITLLMTTSNSIAENTKNLDTLHFVVNGLIHQTNKKLDQNCKVELFYENQVVDSSIMRLNKPFEFKLKKNVWYTIRVTKEGSLPLLISFNTKLDEKDIVDNNLFAFETELIDLQEAKFLNKDLVDFPVGVVAYNKDTRKFEARDVYTQNYISGLYNTNKNSNGDIVKEYVTKRQISNNMC